ncbi:MAG: T9SS type A sorting domain-containing protein [Nitrosopumilus sp.]|nr:T9SS type A sorting domain-containing protein [Nitrosopumilus sp.]
MRKIIVLVMSICSLSLYGQVPDYFANDPKWACGLWNSNQWNPPYIESTSSYVYYLNGDTTIGSITFQRLFSRGEISYFGPIPTSNFDGFTGYYLRQENKSIQFWTNQTGIDSLLVSYNYQIGDTVKGDIFQACYFQSIIQKIDSTLINTEYRTIFYLDSISGPVFTEGIGHQLNINDQSGEFIFPLCQGIGFDYYIHCFGFGAIPYWDSQGTNGNCNLNLSIEENDSVEFSIYPNPFDTYLIAKSKFNAASEILVFDISGKILLRRNFVNEIQLPTSFLDDGFYFYEVRHENRNIQYGKIIKSK